MTREEIEDMIGLGGGRGGGGGGGGEGVNVYVLKVIFLMAVLVQSLGTLRVERY